MSKKEVMRNVDGESSLKEEYKTQLIWMCGENTRNIEKSLNKNKGNKDKAGSSKN